MVTPCLTHRSRRRGGRALRALGVALLIGAPGLEALAEPAAAPVVTSTYQIPLQTFAYPGGSSSGFYKYGINLALGGSSTPTLFEFDTGGDGFFAAYGPTAAWWGSTVTPTGGSFDKTFDSGYRYQGPTLSTSISFFGLGSTPGSAIFTTPALYTVGASERIRLNGADQWTAAAGSSAPPVDQNFFGDFGLTLKRGGDGIENLLAQLTYGGNVSAGYKVALGPYGSSGGAFLQLGLQSGDLSNPDTSWFPMQGLDTSRPFANSGRPSFSAELLSGNLNLSLHGNSTSFNAIGLNLDSGTPGVTLHYNADDAGQLTPFSVLNNDNDPERLRERVMLGLQVVPSGAALAQTLLNFETGDVYGLNKVLTFERGDGNPTYVNTGATLFQSYVVTYDLANQRIGLTPYGVPAPTPLTAGLLSGALGLRLRTLRSRIRAARISGGTQQGGSRATAA